MSQRQAEAFKARLEVLVGRRITGTLDDDTARWVAGLDDAAHAKLAAVGLVPDRQATRLGAWLHAYLAERATDLKPRTQYSYRWTADAMVRHFGADRDLRTITRDDASRWRAALVASGVATSTVRLHCMTARTLIGAAVTRELLARDPFDHLDAGTTPTANKRYVDPAQAATVLAATTDPAARVTFALARFAGLRVPSESHILGWADVDWERGRLAVRSPKTERHESHEQRVVPISAALLPVLGEAFEAAADGDTRVVTGKRSNEYLRQRVQAAARAAEVEPWDDLFRTLRSSCEREWALTFPQYAVSKWIGHSIAVSGKHYTHGDVPDELFERMGGGAAQNPAQHTSARDSKGRKGDPLPPPHAGMGDADNTGFPGRASRCRPVPATTATPLKWKALVHPVVAPQHLAAVEAGQPFGAGLGQADHAVGAEGPPAAAGEGGVALTSSSSSAAANIWALPGSPWRAARPNSWRSTR